MGGSSNSGCFYLVSKHGIQFPHDDNLILIIDVGILAVCDLRTCMPHDILALLNVKFRLPGDLAVPMGRLEADEYMILEICSSG